jgi:hypothetical protein
VVEAVAGDAARSDPALLGLELPEELDVLEVYIVELRLAESANFGFAKFSSASSFEILLLHFSLRYFYGL